MEKQQKKRRHPLLTLILLRAKESVKAQAFLSIKEKLFRILKEGDDLWYEAADMFGLLGEDLNVDDANMIKSILRGDDPDDDDDDEVLEEHDLRRLIQALKRLQELKSTTQE